jgi:hypothetical protein
VQTGALSVLEETELKGGKFGVIRSLLRALDGGAAAKAALDAVVDACAAMQVGGPQLGSLPAAASAACLLLHLKLLLLWDP